MAARNAIHPGMHLADICCPVMLTDLGMVDPKAALDAAQAVTHFGAGGRDQGALHRVAGPSGPVPRQPVPERGTVCCTRRRPIWARRATGNHFLFIGRSRATGGWAMVTHHGSRGPGGLFYKAGIEG